MYFEHPTSNWKLSADRAYPVRARPTPGGASAGGRRAMALGTGEFRYEVVEGWEQLPAGWQHKDVAGVAVDANDRVYLITRSQARVIVYERDGTFVAAWGENE